MKTIFFILLIFLFACAEKADESSVSVDVIDGPKGTLFIIGGGMRPDGMIQEMVRLARFDVSGYAMVLTQSSSEPDTSYHYISRQIKQFTPRQVLMVSDSVFTSALRDSISNAALIFITGGDQNRFLEKVDTETRRAITTAYQNGAVIAGTSAGAALMSKLMITGDQHLVPTYESTYSWLRYENGIYAEGLGLLDSVIIDQHFIARSRYNRLISILADTEYPVAVGIDESTALVIAPNYTTVVGENQVVVFHRPDSFTENDNRIGLRNMQVNIYLQGDTFKLF